jgi:hypothetical protein
VSSLDTVHLLGSSDTDDSTTRDHAVSTLAQVSSHFATANLVSSDTAHRTIPVDNTEPAPGVDGMAPTVTNGIHTANIALQCNYLSCTLIRGHDGKGGAGVD